VGVASYYFYSGDLGRIWRVAEALENIAGGESIHGQWAGYSRLAQGPPPPNPCATFRGEIDASIEEERNAWD
jgi:hypothetical protein